ncbi:thiopurine S-methyltransferase [Legionella hackeliae]|uniref:thiopurine S-methyltransferase n=1 Tax=Legionella hackeliae TaxID=449 RepID=UPI001E46B47B|nr:thiopurine S-methyltransferase [Legionella hackeliae]
MNTWQEGRIPFHQNAVNSDLINYWPLLNLPRETTVLVPLCGKSLDMLWLVEKGFHVVGIELSEVAVSQFAQENNLSMTRTIKEDSIYYSTDFISIWVVDIFHLGSNLITVDAIYDRASLIALPKPLRQSYVDQCLQWLKPNGRILLKTISYTENDIEGPPFSVTNEEVHELYKTCQIVNCIKSDKREFVSSEHLSTQGVRELIDYTWIIQY